MNSLATSPAGAAAYADPAQALADLLDHQKQAFLKRPMPSAAERIERLKKLQAMLLDQKDAIAAAINQDYGNRSVHETLIGELMTCVDQIKYSIKNLPKWMQPSRRHINPMHQPAKGWVRYQPMGVVGIMTPWNYPLLLSMGPLICALSAGNHAMIKMSSASPALGALMEKELAEIFPSSLVAVVNGGGAVSDAFCRLPFDQLTFTGSTSVGKTVMAAAAENLTPVLLELGGKSPAVIHPSMPMLDAAERLTFGKFWNAGQTCVAPDYAFVPRGKSQEFIEAMRQMFSKGYPTLRDNPDYTSIINDKQYRRLRGYLDDAREKGAVLHEFNPANESLDGTRKLAPVMITNTTPDMLVCQDELFGPLLVVHEYDHIDQVVDYITRRPRPLAMYYFDYDEARGLALSERVHSGHFGINQVITHVAQDDLPFGGIGASGMGKYHGHEGFLTMSHARSVMVRPKMYVMRAILPPFGLVQNLLIKAALR